MDVVFGREARDFLRAVCVPVRIPVLEGFLLGHRRGPVFFVERMLPFGPVFSLTEDDIRRIGRIFDGTLLGAFTFRPAPARRKRILSPSFYGTLFGQSAGPTGSGRIRLDMFLVDYDRTFTLKPLPVRPGRRPV